MRVLVTGAAGFLGTHLLQLLGERGHQAWGMDKRWGSSTVHADSITRAVREHRPDLIVHLGANCSTERSLDDPAGDFRDNAVGTFNVCEAARAAGGVPILFTSTVKVNIGHDHRIAPLGLSKAVAEHYLHLYVNLYGQSSVVLRPSTVYGPGQQGTADSGWFTWFARAAATGQLIEIAGDGSQSRDVLYVDDMVALLADIAENFTAYSGPGFQQYEVGGGPDNEVSLLQLLDALDYHNTATVPRLPGDLQRVVSDNGPVGSVRGWKPTVPWRDGLARTRKWLETQQ